MLAPLLAAVLIAAGAEGAEEKKSFPPPTGSAAEAIQVLQDAVDDEQQASAAVARAIELLNKSSPVGEKLAEVEGDKAPAEVVQQALEMLSFEPIHEADLPKGFPTYTPVGAIEVKQYPKHRRAEADDFFKLFRHITTREIAMTAPVRMEFKEGGDDLSQESMAFFYGDKETGETGDDGEVTTLDAGEQLVVALGCRGEQTEESLEEGRGRLLKWLEANPKYKQAGDVVVMGYNSPMVPRKSNFYEVQLPIAENEESSE